MTEPSSHISHFERFIRSPKAIVGAAFVAVGALVSVYAFIDDGNDQLRETIVSHFEALGRVDAIANDDLNYRLGIDRGVHIGRALCSIEGGAGILDSGEVARLLQEGT